MTKFKCIFIFIFLLTIFSINEVSGLINYNGIFNNKVIYIDAGHGGADPGAVYKDLKESDINLNFSKVLGNKLEQLGAIVLYTREGDYDLASTKNNRKRSDLSNRVRIINETKPDIYLSIHVNSDSNATWHGMQVFYNDINKYNIKLAESISSLLKKENISNRETTKIKNIYMYDRIKYPGVLLELGFISNYSDRQKMTEKKYIDNLSNIIIKGIVKYFKNI